MGPLDGIRVADFSRDVAGAYGPALLSQLGAEVIKVESPRYPDPIRYVAQILGNAEAAGRSLEESPEFNSLNANKLSLGVDLTVPQGVEIARRLVKVSDAVVENFRPSGMEKLGLDYPTLKQIKPDIIMLSVSAWGAGGCDSDYGAYAPVFSAVGGLSHLTGYEDAPPSLVRLASDAIGASMSTFALLAALNHRLSTGQGQHIDFSCVANIACLIGDAVVEYSMTGRVPERTGNRDNCHAPHNCYRCQGEDQWISIAVGTEAEWQALCLALGHPEWRDDPRFAAAPQRCRHHQELDRLIEEWTSQRTPYQAMHLLQQAGVAAVPSFSSADLYHDPHLSQRGFWVEVEHPVMGKQAIMAPPWQFSATPATIRRPAPLLGEHNLWVLSELLGLPEAEIAQLKEERVLF